MSGTRAQVRAVMPRALITVALSVHAYALCCKGFGWRLPGPFGLCVRTGSHLTRLSERRRRPTTPVLSQFRILLIAVYRRSAVRVKVYSVVAIPTAPYDCVHHYLSRGFSVDRHFAQIHSLVLACPPPGAGLIGLSVSLFPSAGRDDAYITYWAAHTLREFGEIANLNGAHLEQSTSLLHVLVLGALSLVTSLPVPAIGPPTSVLFGVLTVVYTYEFARRYVGRWYAMGAAMIVATAAPFVYWTTGGLESTMTALAAIALLYHLTRYLERPGTGRPPPVVWVTMGAFLLARPESIFVIGSVLVGMFVVLRLRSMSVADDRLESYALTIRKLLWAALTSAVLMTAIFAVKMAYFGDWLPQPVAAKLGGDALLSGMGEGTEYLINALLPPPLSLLPFFSIAGVVYFARKIALDEEEFTGGLLLSLYTLAYIAFILLVGGDWMEGSRFIVPVIPALAVLAVVVIPHIKTPRPAGVRNRRHHCLPHRRRPSGSPSSAPSAPRCGTSRAWSKWTCLSSGTHGSRGPIGHICVTCRLSKSFHIGHQATAARGRWQADHNERTGRIRSLPRAWPAL